MPSIAPSKLWKQMPLDQRLAAAHAFWAEGDDGEGMHAQHVDAILTLARRLNFRPKSVQALPIERRTKQLAASPDVTDAVASRALIAYHLAAQRPLMAAFLDALGIAHENGLIQAETVEPPDPAKLAEAAASLVPNFPAGDVALYLNTLLTQDPETWGRLDGLPQLQAK